MPKPNHDRTLSTPRGCHANASLSSCRWHLCRGRSHQGRTTKPGADVARYGYRKQTPTPRTTQSPPKTAGSFERVVLLAEGLPKQLRQLVNIRGLGLRTPASSNVGSIRTPHGALVHQRVGFLLGGSGGGLVLLSLVALVKGMGSTFTLKHKPDVVKLIS